MANLSDKEQENALNEVRILASIKNPYIIGYKQAFVESNSLWYPLSKIAQSWSTLMTVISIKKLLFIRKNKLYLMKRKYGEH